MVCSGHAGGNGLLHKPSWSHSDEGGQSPEGREDIREERERGETEKGDKWKMWKRRGKKETTGYLHNNSTSLILEISLIFSLHNRYKQL